MNILSFIHKLPLGYSEVWYQKKKFGVTRTDFNAGKSIKVFAEEIGGTHFVSFNYYRTLKGELLKPCEMPEQRVLHFLKHYEFR